MFFLKIKIKWNNIELPLDMLTLANEEQEATSYLHFWSGRGARLFREKGRSLILGLFGERCWKFCPGDKHNWINYLSLDQEKIIKSVEERIISVYVLLEITKCKMLIMKIIITTLNCISITCRSLFKWKDIRNHFLNEPV